MSFPTAEVAPRAYPQVARALLCAVAVALCMSAQYLFQPFVWRNWPVSEVLFGWFEVARDRVLVAVAIALALLAASRLRVGGPRLRAGLLGLSIVVGAVAGELALIAMQSQYAMRESSLLQGRVIQWCGLAFGVSGIHYLWLRNIEAAAASRSNALARSRAEAMLAQTNLQLLRQQIEPHFLFNTLATIRWLRETSPAQGARLLRHLIEYFSSTLFTADSKATLGEEVGLVESYLAIVAARMPGRLTVSIDVPPELRDCPCPSLGLATLVENAVKHGITPAPDGGAIAVSAKRDGDAVRIEVADTGVGFPGAPGMPKGGAGIGLSNLRARMRARHGDAATLSIAAIKPRGVRATIRVPWRGAQ